MKIIFLDIDGVLNHQIFYSSKRQCERRKELPVDAPKGSHDIDREKINLLNLLIEQTGAKVVLSSSWRSGRTVEEIQELLDYNGFVGEVVGKTMYLSFQVIGVEEYNYSVPRGCEIKAWLETNKDILNEKISKVKYVIFDDDSDMLFWQRDKFLWVDPYCGLTPNLIHRAKAILT